MVIPNTKSRTEKGVFINSFECNYTSRTDRMTITVKKVLKEAIKLDADIYHIHDPELLKITKKLKGKGKKIVYDVHEDLPRQIMSKHWIPKPLRKLISIATELYENKIARNLNGIITATPFIEQRFVKINPNTIAVNNFPILTELIINQDYKLKTENYICYVGGITKTRGIFELADGLTKSSATLLLAGKYLESNIKDVLKKHPAYRKIIELGFLNRKDVKELYKKSKIGIVTLHPTVNYIDSLPVKMFEYMAAGIPVIASNFKLWKSIVEENNCGICVDPQNHKEITSAVEKLLKNPEIANEMGKNGQKIVKEFYNWKNEEKKLITFYKSLIE